MTKALRALADHLDRCDHPCRETDVRIALACRHLIRYEEPFDRFGGGKFVGYATPDGTRYLVDSPAWMPKRRPQSTDDPKVILEAVGDAIPAYTGSLDAAMTLEEQGWAIEAKRRFDCDDYYWCDVRVWDTFSGREDGEPVIEFASKGCQNYAAAHCAAWLRAKAHRHKK